MINHLSQCVSGCLSQLVRENKHIRSISFTANGDGDEIVPTPFYYHDKDFGKYIFHLSFIIVKL